MADVDSQACLSMKPEPCDGCYLWHPYAVCFVCFVISLPVLGTTVGISDYKLDCEETLQGIGMSDWLISFSVSLLCYELYFFADLPSYWSNLYARMCIDKLRVAFYYVLTLSLFLWWCTGWYIYAISTECQSTRLGAISLIVLLVSMVEAMVVGCFCLVTFMVRSYIRADHPSNRRDTGRDTDPLLHRSRGWIHTTAEEYSGESGTQSGVGVGGRIAAIIQERDQIRQMQRQHAENQRRRASSGRKSFDNKPSFHSDSSFVENPPHPANATIVQISPADPRPQITPAEPRQNAADGVVDAGGI